HGAGDQPIDCRGVSGTVVGHAQHRSRSDLSVCPACVRWPGPMSAEEPVVFIVDDDQSLCEGLQRLLATVGLKAQTFGSAQEFVSAKRPNVPSCLFLDVRLPGLSGLDLQREVANMGPRSPS